VKSRPDNNTGAVRVAVNTMRARLTLLGFNLAVASFQLTGLPLRSGGVTIPGLDYPMHLAPGIVLLLGIALSFAAMVAFVASGRLDERGDCSHWSLLLGDVLMYLAMAQTLTGLFEPFIGDLETARLDGTPAGAAFGALRAVLVTAGGVAWAAAAYVGPVVSLLRSPFGRGATTISANLF